MIPAARTGEPEEAGEASGEASARALGAERLGEVGAQAAQILAAGLGGLAFALAGIPAAWLSGAVVATVAWNALGRGRRGRPLARPLGDAAMLVSGASMGAGVTPDALAAVAHYPSSLLALALGVAASTAASMIWLVRASGWRADDALLASAPGAFSTVLAVAIDRGADVPGIAVVQSFRIFVLLTLLPSAVVWLGAPGAVTGAVTGVAAGAVAGAAAGATAGVAPDGGLLFAARASPAASPAVLAAMLAGGLALGEAFRRWRVAAPVLLGGTLTSTLLHATGLGPGVIPAPIATLGLVLIGVFVAERFRHLDAAALRATIPAALGSFLLSMAGAGLFAALAAALARVTLADALVAFAPGGLEAMMVLSLVLGLDPLYVGTHHLARFLGIGLVLPLVFDRLRRRGPPPQPRPDRPGDHPRGPQPRPGARTWRPGG